MIGVAKLEDAGSQVAIATSPTAKKRIILDIGNNRIKRSTSIVLQKFILYEKADMKFFGFDAVWFDE